MSVERAVETTIRYARKFGCSLSGEEIAERLISKRQYRHKEVTDAAAKMGVSKKNSNKIWQGKVGKGKWLANYIEKKIPLVVFMGLTGSVATKHPKQEDDVDFLIVTRRNSLWLCRLWLKFILVKEHIPHRRYGQKEAGNDFCFNLWLDEEKLSIPKNRRRLRTAVDLVLLMPLFDKASIYKRLIDENNWAASFVATPYEKKRRMSGDIKSVESYVTILLVIFNYFVFLAQYIYMRGKMKKGEEASIHQAFFNVKG
ncbi:MAG: hypothetical protein ACOX6N_01790 [Patescibacteria group bacterium]|jgi:hypothetical protein